MPNQKKFGTFAGVFTPSLLTILGVIMYMRLGWVVGNAGLIGVIVIIMIAHVISLTTGLSISSIATDKKVGAGGVYYVLSRSLGLPIGGAIGVTLFVGTALSIALYLIGFAESFIAYFGITADINNLRIFGSLALLILTVLAFISTSLALKTQFFILVAIILSLVSIVLGTSPEAPVSMHLFVTEGSVSMEQIFAIFFPAVTGFTAGIAMSGDLKNPKKSIPAGTMFAIAVGFIIYMGLAIFIYFSVNSELLKTDNNILIKMALFAPAVIAGIWGATLSSALGGILGAPRILQAMSVDKITPKRFALGVGKGNEPRLALIFTVLIAEAGILIGELDTIARVCTMFYLSAYGFINLSFYLESWASSDFNPTFKVKKWIGLLGFIATFIVMFRLDMLAMIIAFIVIGGIYFWLAKRELALRTGDIWQSVWSSVVKTGLRRMDEGEDNKRNWKPNVLLFSGGSSHRQYLLEFSKELVGNRGIVTNFDLYENKEAKILFPKHSQSVNDELIQQYGAFGRQLEVKNVFKGIETIASTFGFSGIDPNTILMGWAKNTKDPKWFAEMTRKLIELDYNVLYLDYDERFGFRKYREIDLWWRGIGNNAELMLNISKFLLSSGLWRNAKIRILVVDDTNSNKKVIEKKINKLLEESRVFASVKIISNGLENRPLYEHMKIYSSEADLILVGIPEIKPEKVKDFVSTTNDLVRTIGTTLLVKASSQFGDLQFVTPEVEIKEENDTVNNLIPELQDRIFSDNKDLDNKISNIEEELHSFSMNLIENPVKTISDKYTGFYNVILSELNSLDKHFDSTQIIYQNFLYFLQKLQNKLLQIRTEELPVIKEIFNEDNSVFIESIESFVNHLPASLRIESGGIQKKIKLRKSAKLLKNKILFSDLRNIYSEFGLSCYENLFKTQIEITAKIYSFFELKDIYQDKEEFNEELTTVAAEIRQLVIRQKSFFQNLPQLFEFELMNAIRHYSNEMTELFMHQDFKTSFKGLKKNQDLKKQKLESEEINFFPAIWCKNQIAIHHTIENNLKLSEANLLINKGLRSLSQEVSDEINRRIEKQFEEHKYVIDKLIEENGSDSTRKSLDNFIIDESAFPGIDNLMQILKTETSQISEFIQEDAILMNKSLMEDFETLQMEGIPTISLDLPKIVDFMIESQLIGPVQNNLERYLSDSFNYYFNQINRVNLLKYSLSESRKASQISELLNEVQSKFSKEKELYEVTRNRFREDLRAAAYDLQMELDVHYLNENADNWSRYIRVSKRKKGIARINELVKNKVSEWYNSFKGTISAKQHESKVSVFESKYDLKTNVEMGLNYVRTMYPDQAVLESLPFYYKQLFQGKHLPVQNDYIGRARELEQVDKAISDKRRGAFLIAGNSASGKTHFSEYIASAKFKGKVFRIDSAGEQGTAISLQKSVETATGNKGTIEQCFSLLPKNSVVILNDIEVWWDRSIEVDALTELIEVIEKYNQKYTFILNVNLYALEALNNLGLLNKAVTTTIILTPATRNELKSIIIEKHKIGGLDAEFNGDENISEGKYFNRLIQKIFTESGGNIGLGLQIWLRQIDKFSNNKLYMIEQPAIEMPKIKAAEWKWLLYHFILNKNLTKSKLNRLLIEDVGILENITELQKAEIIEEVRKNTFTLNQVVKPNIENWLKNMNILN